MVFDVLWPVDRHAQVDLWDYSVFASPGKALRVAQGASSICSQKIPSAEDERKIKSHIRMVTAIGRLSKPYSVWLR